MMVLCCECILHFFKCCSHNSVVVTLRELCGSGNRDSIERTQVSAWVKSDEPFSVLNPAVFCFNAGTLNSDVLRYRGIVTAYACHSCNKNQLNMKYEV